MPVVLISRKAEAADVEWARLQGADGYLTEPFVAERLLDTVNQWVCR